MVQGVCDAEGEQCTVAVRMFPKHTDVSIYVKKRKKETNPVIFPICIK